MARRLPPANRPAPGPFPILQEEETLMTNPTIEESLSAFRDRFSAVQLSNSGKTEAGEDRWRLTVLPPTGQAAASFRGNLEEVFAQASEFALEFEPEGYKEPKQY